MFDHTDPDDRWEQRRKRREEWRAQWRARREEWRAQRAQRRAQWYGAWGHQAWGQQPWSQAGQADAELKATVEQMKRTIEALTERVKVLEKLAVDPEKNLAAEIEKLRDKPAGS